MAGAALLGGSGRVLAQAGAPALLEQHSGTVALLQAVSPVDERVVWVGGHQGVILRTLDGGGEWARIPTPGGDTLQFRDVHAFGPDVAVALSAGPGALSRLYRTTDGGGTWSLAFLMDDARGFLDCLDFVDDRRGYAYGDAFDGVPYLLQTADGGQTWARVPASELPAAGEGEGGFAASGTCVRAAPDGGVWVATGAGGHARLLSLAPGSRAWNAREAPVVRGEAAGLTTVSFGPEGQGIALGGDLGQMEARTANVLVTQDGGRTWAAGMPLRMTGPVYGSAWRPGTPGVVAVGPAGADWSPDAGTTWQALSDRAFWAVGFAPGGVGWMVGPEGRVVRIGG